MEDELWFLTQKLREVTEYRLDTRAVWNDEAAYEINGHFLNPLEEDATEMVKELNLQMDFLQQVDGKLENASQLARKAEKLSREVTQHLQEADEMNLNVHTHLDLFVHHNTEALEIMPQVYHFIAQANESC